MTVLVTGASGFLGGRLAERLAQGGERVVVLARPNADLRHLADVPVQVVRGGLTDRKAVRQAVREAEVVFHCAAASTDWALPQVYYESNVLGTEVLLAAAREASSLRRFVHVSTTDVYGYPMVPCDEAGKLLDAGLPYNQTKLRAELAVWASGLPVTVVRPATIYGPRGAAFVTDIAKLLFERQMAYIAGGRVRGGFLYVDNAVDALLTAAGSESAAGQAYNLTDATDRSWREYVELLARELGCKPPWIDLPFSVAMGVAQAMEAPYRWLPSLPGRPMLTRHAVQLLGRDQEFPVAKARAELGFASRVGFEEGVARSAEWFLRSR